MSSELGFEHDEFGIIVPWDAGEKAALTGYTGGAAFRALDEHLAKEAAIANGSHRNGYAWTDLTDPAYATPPDPPAIEGLLYAGRRHVISGPPESTKTLIAYLLLLQALRAQEGVCILDFEMGPHAAVTLLRELGATNDELAAIHYTEPDGPPTPDDLERIIGLGVTYTLIDAAAGAYDVSGLDDNARKDAEQFAAKWVKPLWQNGVATIVIDHVVKSVEGRGSWVIGSERKIGQCDVHLSLESLKPLTRGGDGMVKINVKRDRPGHLTRPTAVMVDLTSDPDTHQVTVTYRTPEPSLEPVTGEFRHTIYMERVSRVLESNDGQPMSKNQIETADGGNRDHIRTAISELVKDGFCATQDGPRNSILIHLQRRFRKDEYDLAHTSPPPRPGEVVHDLAPTSPPTPYKGGRKGEVEAGMDTPPGSDDLAQPEINIYDADIQHLLDDPDY